MVREITVDWQLANSPGGTTVLYFDDVGTVADQRAALDDFLNACTVSLHTSTTYTIATSGREMDTATGALTGQWVESTAYTDNGAQTGQPVANATMILLRWETGQVVSGRFLKGRTFLPGATSGVITAGEVQASTQTALNDAMETYIASNGAHSVWHRPTDGAGGVAFQVTAGTTWNEFAVLRQRR